MYLIYDKIHLQLVVVIFGNDGRVLAIGKEGAVGVNFNIRF